MTAAKLDAIQTG